jgi:hypothetical protein
MSKDIFRGAMVWRYTERRRANALLSENSQMIFGMRIALDRATEQDVQALIQVAVKN